jgi:far upstream element-binding protein
MNNQSIYGPSSSIGDEGYQVELRVPNHMVGLVIGKGGENIHRMQTQTGAHMQIAKEADMKPGRLIMFILLLLLY